MNNKGSIIFLGMFLLAVIAGTIMLTDNEPDITHGPRSEPETHELGSGAHVQVLRLNDGTRCAVYRGYNVDCDWGRNDLTVEDVAIIGDQCVTQQELNSWTRESLTDKRPL